jgi:hypothetical protein
MVDDELNTNVTAKKSGGFVKYTAMRQPVCWLPCYVLYMKIWVTAIVSLEEVAMIDEKRAWQVNVADDV